MKRVLLLAAFIAALPYALTPVYRFPAAAPFSGDQFYNPYAHISGPWPGAVWQRSNFHAHSRSWSGVTSGQQSDEEVAHAYRQLGYTVPGLSNYHRIAHPPEGADLPMYEHGYNLGKHHQLAIGASRVVWFDFPLLQLTSQKQLIIDSLKAHAELVAIAHPSGRMSYLARDMKALTGYQLIEVVNGPFADDGPWDQALSAGRAVWGLANDDNHDTKDADRLGLSWNLLGAPTATRADVIDALRAGRFYSVMREYDPPDAELTKIETVDFKDGTLTITCSGAQPAIEFLGQGGIVKKVVRDAMTGSYTFEAGDSYIRTIIWSPRQVMYLNPIIRWNGSALPAALATVNQPATWLLRAALAAAVAFVIVRKRRA